MTAERYPTRPSVSFRPRPWVSVTCEDGIAYFRTETGETSMYMPEEEWRAMLARGVEPKGRVRP